jgi:hypothetical protein
VTSVELESIDDVVTVPVWDSINLFQFKVSCHVSATDFIQFYGIKFYSIIFFRAGGPGGETFAISGTAGFGMLGSGNGLPRLVSFLEDVACFLPIPGSPFFILVR